MAIDWFPGHMLTARRHAGEALPKNDVVIEVLDARVPYSSCSPMLEAMRLEAKRPALKILNKSDLADPARTQQWLQFYNNQPGVRAMAISCKKPRDAKRIPEKALELAPGRATAQKPLRLMIQGIPNVGKSTLMNALFGREMARVGDQPGVTKKHLVHELGNFVWVTDTAGLLWPGIEQVAALKLCATHNIGGNAFDEFLVASDLAAYLQANYPELLQKRFAELPPDADAHGVISWIAKRRGLIVKGGAPDLDKAGLVLLHEFRNGTLGQISLETPAELPERAAVSRKR